MHYERIAPTGTKAPGRTPATTPADVAAGGDYIVDIRNVSELTSSGQDIGAFLLHFTGGAASTDPNGVLKRPFPAPTASLTADG
jgi:hypothetical protein